VSAATGPSPKKPPLWRRIRDTVDAYPDAAGIALYALVAMAALVVAYFTIFSEFATYDDEGTLLVTVKAFVNGHALYSDIWSVYGPFYYELFGGLFSLSGLSVTTDASRTIVIVVWVASSLLYGLAAQRLTGRLMLGVTAMIAAFAALIVLANEPMHPQGLCVALLGALALVAASGPGRRINLAGAACGAILAALVLTKVNLGIFGVAALVAAAAVAVEPIHRRPWLRWILVLAFLALPVLILHRDLGLSWVRELLVLEALAAIAILIASRSIWPERKEDDGGTLRWILAAAAGFAVAFMAILVVIFITGPSPSAVYDGMVKDALGIKNIIEIQFPFPPGATLDWAIGAVAAAALASRLRLAGGDGPSLWTGLLRGAAGLVILLSVAHIVPVALSPSSINPIVVPMLLAWVVTIPPAGALEPPYRRFLRVLLPMLAVAETLQVYPVAGSQMGIAAVSFVPVGALCLGDAVVELQAWSRARGAAAQQNFGAALAVLTVALPAMFGLNVIVLPAVSKAIIYRDQEKLPLPGAELMHLPSPTVELYTDVVNLLHQHKCSTFVGYPDVNSLYLWSGIEPPAPSIPNAWMYGTSDSQQQQVVDEMRASPRPCVVKNDELAAPYLKGLPPPHTPLVEYVLNDFRAVAEVGPFELLLPKASARGTG
jgi:hypothetical protein